jgi:hypothetical protein
MRQAIAENRGGAKVKLSKDQSAVVARYILARRQAAQAAATMEMIKGEVMSIVNMSGGRVLMLEAMVHRGASVSYLYPKSILRAEDKLKQQKKIMQLDGRAEKITKDCLLFEDFAGKKTTNEH